MKLLTKTNLKTMALASWREQYQTNGKWHPRECKLIYDSLCGLPNSATEDDIAEIIGNDSYTTIECMECYQSVNEAVDFGYGEDRQILCLDCLDIGTKMLLSHLDEKRKS